ncbi:hypothetical protein ACH427_27915 [Streptomyces sp. NPDC020379]|uniref:hypothetical protein n=1 Tax=Streptomyces sp. NPDC020379 TaxID=3365071 RepID=UPI0037A98C33
MIIHTCAGRVWRLAEMCAHCAKATATLGGTPAEYLLEDPESSLATPPPGARYDGRVHAAWVLGCEGFSAEWLARTLDLPYEDAARIHSLAHPPHPGAGAATRDGASVRDEADVAHRSPGRPAAASGHGARTP